MPRLRDVAMAAPQSDTFVLLQRSAAGDRQAWGQLLTRHADRLRRMIEFRMDSRLRARLDPSDVLQEACLEASERLDDYFRDRSMPFYVWLRFLAAQKLVTLHRYHFGVQKRDPSREISLSHGVSPQASSVSLAARLLACGSTPSGATIRAERQERLQKAIDQLDPVDREIIALRHFEQFRNAETAQILGIPESTASTRYLRALRRLRQLLGDLGEELNELGV